MSRENFIYLMKFQNLDILKSIQSGKLYMKNINYFIQLEKAEKERYRSDAGESSVLIPNSWMKMKSDSRDLEFEIKRIVYTGGHLKQPIFCLFSFDYRNIIEDNGKLKMVFTDEQKEELKKFGTHALLINDANAFVSRIKNALDKEKISYRFAFVKYYKDSEQIERFTDISLGRKHIAFTKDYDPFARQQEYRIVVVKHFCNTYG